MKLVLYSGGQEPSNRLIHHALFQLVNPRRNKSMTYIPFARIGLTSFLRRPSNGTRASALRGFTAFRWMYPLHETISTRRSGVM